MSKIGLRKELAGFDADQLRQIILKAYDSSAEAKAYFEFFLNPDVEAFVEERNDAINKELRRGKYGRCKARISEIRRQIKMAVNYGLPPEAVAKVMLNAITLLYSLEQYLRFPDTLINGTQKLVGDYIVYCNRYEMVAQAMCDINALLDREELGSRYFRKLLRQAAVNAVEQCSRLQA